MSYDISFDADEFAGRVRLFPLPKFIMFPHALEALHIFEPRYRSMLEAALEDDQMLATATLLPGWEASYDGRPEIFPIACLGRLAAHHRLEDGRYNILLVGLRRVKIVSELDLGTAYRQAEVEVLEDFYPAGGEAQREQLQERLSKAFRRSLPPSPQMAEQLDELLRGDLSLGALTDLVCHTTDLELPLKQRLLAEPNVDNRAELLIERLAGVPPQGPNFSPGPRKFPPDFSDN